MNKIGYIIDEKINKASKDEKKEERKRPRGEKTEEQLKEYQKIFARFEELAYNDNANVKIS